MDQFFQEVASTILVPLVSALVTAGVAFLVARISEVLKDMKEKKVSVSEADIADVQRGYSSAIDGNVMENNIENAMQILGTTYMRKDM